MTRLTIVSTILIIIIIISDIVPNDEVNCAENNNNGEKGEEYCHPESLNSQQATF